MDHAEPEFFSQARNEIKIRVSEANRRRLECVVLHGYKCLADGSNGVVAAEH